MQIDTPDLITGLGLALFMEGLLYSVFPGGMKRMVVEIMQLPPRMIRALGLLAMASGIFVVWLVRG